MGLRKLTVKELIEILETFPKSAEVSAYYALYVNDEKIELVKKVK